MSLMKQSEMMTERNTKIAVKKNLWKNKVKSVEIFSKQIKDLNLIQVEDRNMVVVETEDMVHLM